MSQDSTVELGRQIRELAAGDAARIEAAVGAILLAQIEFHADDPESGKALPDPFRAAVEAALEMDPAGCDTVRRLFDQVLAAESQLQGAGWSFLMMANSFRVMVLENCGRTATPLLPRLRELLASDSWAISGLAARMIGGQKAQDAAVARDQLFATLHARYGLGLPSPSAQALARLATDDPVVLAQVIDDLSSSHGPVWGGACLVLFELGPPGASAVSGLLELVHRGDGYPVVVGALGALGVADRAVIDVLLERLKQPGNSVRAAALEALGALAGAPEMATRRVVAAICGFLQDWQPPWEGGSDDDFDPDSDDFWAAIGALGSFGGNAATALPLLESLLEGPDVHEDGGDTLNWIRKTIERIRGPIGDTRQQEHLCAL